jgi:hypothetical protein
VELPSRDPAQWRRYLAENQASLQPGVCTRRGRPHSPGVTASELDSGPCTPTEREVLRYELATRGGLLCRLDPRAFVATQEAQLDVLHAAIARTGAAPGSWALPLQRRPI